LFLELKLAQIFEYFKNRLKFNDKEGYKMAIINNIENAADDFLAGTDVTETDQEGVQLASKYPR